MLTEWPSKEGSHRSLASLADAAAAVAAIRQRRRRQSHVPNPVKLGRRIKEPIT